MLFIFFQDFDDFVLVDDVKVFLYTDFRLWLRAFKMVLDDADPLEVLNVLVVQFPVEVNLLHLFNAVGEFLVGNVSSDKSGDFAEPVFDFVFDESLIYAAFYQQYGIDLCAVHMHWHKFLMLFKGLEEDTLFVKVLGFRSADLKLLDASARDYYRRLKAFWALPKSSQDRLLLDNLKQKLEGGLLDE